MNRIRLICKGAAEISGNPFIIMCIYEMKRSKNDRHCGKVYQGTAQIQRHF